VYRCVVSPGSVAEGTTVAELDIGDDAWINMIRREGQLLQTRGDTTLRAGDELLLQAEPESDLQQLFRGPPAP